MLDMQTEFQNNVSAKLENGPLDPSKLLEMLNSFSTDDLEKLEDDLDFARFTGIQSPAIQHLVTRLESTDMELVA